MSEKESIMKKNFVGIFVLILLVGMAWGQSVDTATVVWKVSTTAAGCSGISNTNAVVLMDTNGDTRGLDYSTTYNRIYMLKCPTGIGQQKVYVINANDGTTTGNGYNQTGMLNLSIVKNMGLRTLNKLHLSDDEVIFAVNLVDDISKKSLIVYCWTNPTTAGSIAIETSLTVTGATSQRFGDTVSVIGSGVSRQIYVSGQGNNRILKFTSSNGTTFRINSIITTQAGTGSNDIDALSVDGNIWTSGCVDNMPTILIDSTGVARDTVNTAVVPTSWAGCDLAPANNGKTYIMKVNASTLSGDKRAYLVDITGGGSAAFIKMTTPVIGTSPTSDSVVGMSWDKVNGVGYFMLSNNGYAKMSFNQYVPVELSEFLSE